MINNEYINELIQKLVHTEIWNGTNRKCEDYTEGIKLLVDTFSRHKKKESKLFFIGNGGSSSIASHMTADFMKNGGMHTYSLYDSAVITCMGNDFGYEFIFSHPLKALLGANDLLVAISSSGSSADIVNAISISKMRGASIITFTGFEPENKIRQMGNVNVYVPCKKYGIVESIHNLILQQVVDIIMDRDGVSF